MTDSSSIRDIILFPAMKPETAQEKANAKAAEEAAMAETGNDGFFKPNSEIDFSKAKVEPLFTDYVDFDTFSKSDFRAVKVKSCEAVKKSKKLLKFVLDDGTGTDRIILSGIHAFYEPEELVGKTLIAIVNLPPRAMMGIDSCGMLLSAIHEEEGEEKTPPPHGRQPHPGRRKTLLINNEKAFFPEMEGRFFSLGNWGKARAARFSCPR